MGRDDGRKKPDAPAAPFNNPFASLQNLRGGLPSVPTPEPKAIPPKAPVGPARAVVRYERKGRGGKEVTVVSHLELPAAELERWTKQLKNSLGCGGHVEGDQIVLQGDQRERLPARLTELGARKVTVS
jgi:translation initiation factor 1